MKKRIEIIENSMRKTKEKEEIQVVIKSADGSVHEIENTDSVICLTMNESDTRIKTLVAGSFSIKTMLEYVEAIDTVKKELLKRAASQIDPALGSIIDILGGKD